MSSADDLRVEPVRARQEVMLASRQRYSPVPPTRESPPRPAKSAALASIAAQSSRPFPARDRPDYVPVATIMKESSRHGSIGSVSTADARFHDASVERNVAAARRTGDILGSPSSSSGSSVELLNGGLTPKKGGLKDDDDIPSDFDEEPTDAEVGKWSFHERLVHYLDGEKISHSIRKAVECVILIEGGTYIRNLNPMKKPQMVALLLNKYQSLIEDIEDHHFSSNNVREDMLRGYKGAKKGLTGDTLWRKLEKEMTAVKTFASKFPGVNCPSQLPSGTAQLRQMKKPLIIKLWKEENEQNPVTSCDCCCLISLLPSVLNMCFWHLESSRHRLRGSRIYVGCNST